MPLTSDSVDHTATSTAVIENELRHLNMKVLDLQLVIQHKSRTSASKVALGVLAGMWLFVLSASVPVGFVVAAAMKSAVDSMERTTKRIQDMVEERDADARKKKSTADTFAEQVRAAQERLRKGQSNDQGSYPETAKTPNTSEQK